jgi:hypothetical protein
MSHLGDLAAAVVDGELGHDARDRALAHLAGCLPCRAEVDAQRRIKARLGAMERSDVPSTLAARLAAVPGAALPSPPAVPVRTAAPPPSRRVGSGRVQRVSAERSTALSTRSRFGRTRRPARNRPPGRPVDDPRPWSRTPRRLRRAVVGGTSAVLLSLGVALLVGGGSPADTAAVDPSVNTFVADHMATTGEVPLTDPAVAAVSVSYPR